MQKLKKFLFVFLVFLLGFSQFASAQKYTITEDELQQIEKNQETILEEAQALRAQSKKELDELKTQSKKEQDELKKQSKKELDEVNKQLETQVELYEKSERKRKLILKAGIPAAAAIAACAFCAGFFAGAKAAP